MKRVKSAIANRAIQEVRGLYVEWVDPDPLSTDKAGLTRRVGHTNPVHRLTAAHVFKTYGDWLTFRQRMRWRMNVRVIFRHDDRDEYVDLEAEEMATLDEINDFLLAELEATMAEASARGYLHRHLHTAFRIQCLGHAH